MYCGECKFWEAEKEQSTLGRCRRHAPKTITNGLSEKHVAVTTVWPLTTDQDWCGEWSAKVEVEPGVSY